MSKNYNMFPPSCDECECSSFCDGLYSLDGCKYKDAIEDAVDSVLQSFIDFSDAKPKIEFVKENNDDVNSPKHYLQNKFETIDEMMIVFGPEVVYHFCICNAWKYKNRAPYKGNFEEDMKKADWYLMKAKAIKENKLWQE